jgi:hypothetical protein
LFLPLSQASGVGHFRKLELFLANFVQNTFT